MNKIFGHGVWIWCNASPREDEYGEFVEDFYYWQGRALLRISADSNYAAYLNGRLAAWGQYADFPYDKVYDEVDVTEFLRPGQNRLAVLVWYYGTDTTQVYYPGNAGVLYELACEGQILCASGEKTLSRISRAYESHRKQQITGQLGFSFRYDATREDGWLTGGGAGFAPAVRVPQELPLRIRPCKKLTLLPAVTGTLCRQIDEKDVIFDLGGEQVGFLSFRFTSPCEQEIVIAYGEHLADGCVRRRIGGRDFSVAYRAKEGENIFLNPFRRLGCRYLEIRSQEPLTVDEMSIVPTMYPLEETKRPPMTDIQNKIYEMCVETLKLCMHEHYEDCPWREQALYTMDSRNQMLCGYYAFGEFEFPRACLQLISRDKREDGLLSICYPMKRDLVIPSFTLHYLTECREYLDYSGDVEFLREIYPRLVSCLKPFEDRRKDGLVLPFEGENDWNFYEWRPGLDGAGADPETPDLILNCLMSLALGNLAEIAGRLGVENQYAYQAQQLNARIGEVFREESGGRFYDDPKHRRGSQLGNALAVLCGAADGPKAGEVCERLLNDGTLTPLSLSMQCFKYDAWLKVDRQQYAPVILAEIERIYLPMVTSGSTTVWETELGEADFEQAGSLCHGWSAMPVYYYHRLLP